ncbi:MAG: Flp pilus assembly complex ATPase component TadA [Armatimonadota bacterium]|nr:MAG: Flp pilus assembly complex ATPase component TadA [Armatimonadota bacterium]
MASRNDEETVAAATEVSVQPLHDEDDNGLSAEVRKKLANQRLGDILVAAQLITEEQLAQALVSQQKERGKRLGQILVESGAVNSEALGFALSLQLGLPYISLDDFTVDPAVLRLIPEDVARRYGVFPVRREQNTLTLAISDPFDIEALDRVRAITGLNIREVITQVEAIHKAIETHYGGDVLSDIVERISAETTSYSSVEQEFHDLAQLSSETSVVAFVNRFLAQAIERKASDIHIVPQQERVEVYYRIDGVLQHQLDISREALAAVVSRIKILGDMDITEHRLPLDGRARLKAGKRLCDLRISTIPTVTGESVAIRVLDKTTSLQDLNSLGFTESDLAAYRGLTKKPHGMVLMTGPTGSGKTTTLYATLLELKMEVPRQHIITVEDPVEYEVGQINQLQVKPKIGFTFANALRYIVRHDPDIVMVGEIRDSETAKLAVQAALTGHRVLSSFHTNDAAGALTRLIDMEVEPYLVASSVLGVLAQRLVRTLCPHCKDEFTPPEDVARQFAADSEVPQVLYRAKGCRRCADTGYSGRTAVYELLIVAEPIRRLVVGRQASNTIQLAAVESGMIPMRDNLAAKVRAGVTSAEEAFRLGLQSDEADQDEQTP